MFANHSLILVQNSIIVIKVNAKSTLNTELSLAQVHYCKAIIPLVCLSPYRFKRRWGLKSKHVK